MPGTDVVRLVPFAEVRRCRALLPRNRRADHRAAVDERCRRSADVRIDDDVESVEEARPLELLLGDICVWNAHLIEREADPSFVLRFDPRVQKRRCAERRSRASSP